MNLPRDLWPGVGGWQGPPPGEQGAPLEVAPGDELFPKQNEKENDMAKEKADSDKRGRFARWRERAGRDNSARSKSSVSWATHTAETNSGPGGMCLLLVVVPAERQVVRQPRRKSGEESSFGLNPAASRLRVSPSAAPSAVTAGLRSTRDATSLGSTVEFVTNRPG